MAKFFNWLKAGEIIGIIAAIITIVSVVFGIGMFYNKVDNLESNLTIKLNDHKEMVKTAIDDQNKRIDDLQNMVSSNLDDFKSGVQGQITRQTAELKRSSKPMYMVTETHAMIAQKMDTIMSMKVEKVHDTIFMHETTR
jgi:hypothetical protein